MKAIKDLIGKRVVIRSYGAGVFYGILTEAESMGDKYAVELTDARRLWYWDGAASITQLAVEGVTAPDNCKFTIRSERVVVASVIEIHGVTEKAIKSIESVKEWKR